MDNIHGSIFLTMFEKLVIATSIFNRLHDVYQNSTAFLTYPCNKTSRFEHSIGTMYLCGNMFFHAISNTGQETLSKFFDRFKNEITTKCSNIDNDEMQHIASAILDDKIGPVKRIKTIPGPPENLVASLAIPPSLKKLGEDAVNLYYLLYQSIRLAGLLHDVGHPPFSHVTEKAIKNVYRDFKDLSSEAAKEVIQILEKYFEVGTQSHEKITIETSKIAIYDVLKNMATELSSEENDCVYGILIFIVVDSILKEDGVFKELHSIIDGPMDGDRLDYVVRDGINSGAIDGKIEYDRICQGMCILEKPEGEDSDRQFYFCPSTKVINSIEDFFLRRCDLYKKMIYHHRVIKTDYILGSVIEMIANLNINEMGNKKSKYEIGDPLPCNISGLWLALKQAGKKEMGNALSQWNDSWLMTTLRTFYFEKYRNKPKEPKINASKTDIESYCLFKKLEELCSNKKNYVSLIKRPEDFTKIEESIAKNIKNIYNSEAYKELVDNLRKESKMYYQENETKEGRVQIEDALKFFDGIPELPERYSKNPSKGELLSRVRKFFEGELPANFLTENENGDDVNKYKDKFQKIVVNAVNNVCNTDSDFKNVVLDNFVVFKKEEFSVGTDGMLLCNDNNRIVGLHDVSPVTDLIYKKRDYFPNFFLYILKRESQKGNNLDIESISQKIGNEIGESIYNSFNKFLDFKIKEFEDKNLKGGD